MPRAYYRPFTAYEEAVGFHGTRRNAYICCALFFSGIIFKVLLAVRFSPVSNRDLVGETANNNPEYAAALQHRAELVEQWTTQDSHQTAMARRRREAQQERYDLQQRHKTRRGEASAAWDEAKENVLLHLSPSHRRTAGDREEVSELIFRNNKSVCNLGPSCSRRRESNSIRTTFLWLCLLPSTFYFLPLYIYIYIYICTSRKILINLVQEVCDTPVTRPDGETNIYIYHHIPTYSHISFLAFPSSFPGVALGFFPLGVACAKRVKYISKPMPIPRPRDLFSAAFLDDTQRLHYLATQGVPGGYVDDDEAELEEEEEQAIDQDEELVRLKKLYIPNPEEDEEQQGNDDDVDDAEDDGYSQEAEEEREGKLERFRKLIRRKLRRRAIAEKINVLGFIKTGLTPVDMREYGVMFRSKERVQPERWAAAVEALSPAEPFADGPRPSSIRSRSHPSNSGAGRLGKNPNPGDGDLPALVGPQSSGSRDGHPSAAATTAVASAAESGDGQGSECFLPRLPGSHTSTASLTVHWKPSKRSRFPAYPLHWAVMGRSHGTLRFLVLNGANPDLVVKDDSGVFPNGLTARHIAEANGLHDTLAVLTTAMKDHQTALREEEEEKQRIESELEQLKAIKERRKMEREQRIADRRAAEEAEEAAAAAAEEAEDGEEGGGDYDDEDD
eukprot:gene8788-6175_t